MNHIHIVLFTFVCLITLTERTEANNLVAYYTAAASTVLIAAAAVIFKVQISAFSTNVVVNYPPSLRTVR